MTDRKTQKRMLSKFIQVFLTTFALLMIVIAIGTVIFVVVSERSISTPRRDSEFKGNTEYPSDTVVDGEIVDNPFNDKKITTFAVFGVDKENYRTDVNMLVIFNHETADIDIISIPRDTRVMIPDDIFEQIQSRRNDVSQIVKINEVPAYVVEGRNEASVAVLEKSLGIDIDYYINLKLDVFRYIVDTIGEINFEVPFDMTYQDPAQDLFINLKAGQQQLNGAQAEQLIRFRAGYSDGDLGRIEMQHEFMKAFINELLTLKNRLNMLNIVGGILLRVETNFEEAVEYLIYLDEIDPDNFRMHTLPGHSEESSRSYFIYDYDATKDLLNDIVNDPYILEQEQAAESENAIEPEPVVDIEPEEIKDVSSLTMQVLNSTDIKGVAGAATGLLESNGYRMIEADNYGEDTLSMTRITVPYVEAYDELSQYFVETEMILRESIINEEPQVIIVLGQKDADKLKE